LLTKIVSVIEALRFFLSKPESCKVIFFKVPSEVLVSYLEYNVFDQINESIKKAFSISNVDDEETQLSKVKDLAKLHWLIESINQEEVYNPIQLIKSSENKYFCHPGYTKVSVASYILNKPYIEGFYVWHTNLDPNPFILDYEHTEVTSAIDFYKKFRINKRSCILTATLTNLSQTVDSDVEFDVFDTAFYLKHYCSSKLIGYFNTLLTCYASLNKPFRVRVITYGDKTQWAKKIDLNYFKSILTNESRLILSNVVFEKKNGQWALVR
jgi:hypothetical protein